MARPDPVRHYTALLLFVALADLAIGWVAGGALEAARNTLARQGNRWHAAKADPAERTPFDEIMLSTTQPLAGGRLNLAAWSGDHELLLAQPVNPKVVSYDLWLGPRGWGALLFDVNALGQDGLLLSSDPAMPSCFFHADASGRFTRHEPLPPPPPAGDRTYKVQLEFSARGVQATIDGGDPIPYASAFPPAQTLGVRGGQGAAAIDNLRIEPAAGGPPLTFDFEDAGLRRRGLAWTLVLLLGVQGTVAFLMLKPREDLDDELEPAPRPARPPLARVVYLWTLLTPMLLAVAVAVGHDVTRRAATYADAALDPHRRTRAALSIPLVTQRLEQIRKDYDALPKREGTLRVMLLGTSQTFGLGAAREQDRLDRALERLLPLTPGALGAGRSGCQVLNVGVTAQRAGELLKLYREQWIQYRPDVLLVNLGNNDQYDYGGVDPRGDFYRDALAGLAELDRQNGIRTIFVLEANSPERDVSLAPQYAIMRQVGQTAGVPVVDANGWLAAHYGDGFLWWDYVNLSSFGQELLARRLAEAIAAPPGARP